MADSFASLVSSISSDLNGLDSPDQLEVARRTSILSKIDQLRDAMMLPLQSLRTVTDEPIRIVVARLAIQMGIFDAFAAKQNDFLPSLTIEDIMPNVKGDHKFVTRMFRLLTMKGFLQLVSPGRWRMTKLGAMLATDSAAASAVIMFYHNLKAYGILDEFLAKTDFQNPGDYRNSPWTYAYNTSDGYFDWIGQDKLRQKSFNTLMLLNQKLRGPDWFEFFPVLDRIQEAKTNDDVLLVDIGGGTGHDALLFREKYPELRGKVVVQELPAVVQEVSKGASWPANFEMREHDGFTSQPIRGASVYYLRSVLHDWPDKQALEILRNVREAMTEDSILLLNEALMPEDCLDEIAINIDFIMMTCMSSLERTEKEWTDLLDAAGFRVAQVWRPAAEKQISATALFEAVPK